MPGRRRAEIWQEIAGGHLGEPVLASVILMRRGMVRDQMLTGLNPVSGVLGGVVEAVVEAGVDAVKQEMQRRLPIKPIPVDGYAYVAASATKFGIIKPAQSFTTSDALRRGKLVLLVPRTVPIKFTMGTKGLVYRDVVLEVGGFAATAFKAQWRHWGELRHMIATLQS